MKKQKIKKEKNVIVLSAGGTGGHFFPAKSLAIDLEKSGYEVHIITDKRALKLAYDFSNITTHVVRSATFKSKKMRSVCKTILDLIIGSYQSYKILNRVRPSVVGGFGGYPTLPPMVVATSFLGKLLKIKTFIHEQNVVMGRANRLLLKRVDRVACGFPLENKFDSDKMVVIGNPVRNEIITASKFFYKEAKKNDKFNLVVFGGSQGAGFFSEIVPQAIRLLPLEYRRRLNLTQQSRDDGKALLDKYKQLNIKADIHPFFNDLPEKLFNAHYVISRAGASTVSEIAVIGRPVLFIPYPHAIDKDQEKNAKSLEQYGSLMRNQHELTAQMLAKILKDAMDNPEKLMVIAKTIKKAGRPNATRDLANMIEEMIGKTDENTH